MSYSTPASFFAGIGPRQRAQLSAESPSSAPDEPVIQGWLNKASKQINMRIGIRYVAPVTGPPAVISNLSELEEQIALFFGYVYRGIDDESAKVGYQAAMDFLNGIAKGEFDLVGVGPRPDPAPGDSGWSSNEVVYRPENFRRF
jgi:phage gp36-like protein